MPNNNDGTRGPVVERSNNLPGSLNRNARVDRGYPQSVASYAQLFNRMNRDDRVQARKTCRNIMQNPSLYDGGLVGMCRALH